MKAQGFRLLDAAEKYGDARVGFEARIKAWKRGDPPPEPIEHELEWYLISAARAYATATRAQRRKDTTTHSAKED